MAHFPIIHGRIDEEIRNREAHEVKVENQIQDLQRQIDEMRSYTR